MSLVKTPPLGNSFFENVLGLRALMVWNGVCEGLCVYAHSHTLLHRCAHAPSACHTQPLTKREVCAHQETHLPSRAQGPVPPLCVAHTPSYQVPGVCLCVPTDQCTLEGSLETLPWSFQSPGFGRSLRIASPPGPGTPTLNPSSSTRGY